MELERDDYIGFDHYKRSDQRRTSHHVYNPRQLYTMAGTSSTCWSLRPVTGSFTHQFWPTPTQREALAWPIWPRPAYRGHQEDGPAVRATLSRTEQQKQVLRIIPNSRSCLRIYGDLLKDQHEDWISGRRYLKMEQLAPFEKNGNLYWLSNSQRKNLHNPKVKI